MELMGQRRLAMDRDHAWRALNDPEVLKACIPDCESIDRAPEGGYRVALSTMLGPVQARIRGRLFMEDVVAPERYTLRFEAESPQGSIQGESKVTLAAEGEATMLAYAVRARVEGRMARMDERLVHASAAKLAEGFLTAFDTHVGGTSHVTPSDVPLPFALFDPRVWSWLGWMALFVAVLALAVIYLR
jgi:uncharacterized protein